MQGAGCRCWRGRFLVQLLLELGATDCLLVAVGQVQLACCLALLLTPSFQSKVPKAPRLAPTTGGWQAAGHNPPPRRRSNPP